MRPERTRNALSRWRTLARDFAAEMRFGAHCFCNSKKETRDQENLAHRKNLLAKDVANSDEDASTYLITTGTKLSEIVE
jgi:hypothetical protein